MTGGVSCFIFDWWYVCCRLGSGFVNDLSVFVHYMLCLFAWQKVAVLFPQFCISPSVQEQTGRQTHTFGFSVTEALVSNIEYTQT